MDAYDAIVFSRTNRGKRIGTAEDMVGAIRAKRVGVLQWLKAEALARFFEFNEEMRGTVAAEVCRGRWLARCPCCAGAEEASYIVPVFYCLSCGNALNDGCVMTVEFPEGREALEELLLKRNIENRNWRAGETVELLQKENEEHGLGFS